LGVEELEQVASEDAVAAGAGKREVDVEEERADEAIFIGGGGKAHSGLAR
jgi:hypothetical protein